MNPSFQAIEIASWEHLLGLLRQECAQLEILKTTLEEQLEALRRIDLEALDRCVEAENAVLFLLHRIERQRRELLRHMGTMLGLETEEISCEWLLEGAPERFGNQLRSHLLKRRMLLEGVLACQVRVQKVLEYAQQLLRDRYREIAPPGAVIAYDRTGSRAGAVEASWIDQTA
nr:MAG: hypothetical protein KatS3mg041_1190 [Bacteroidota bacterium]